MARSIGAQILVLIVGHGGHAHELVIAHMQLAATVASISWRS